MTGSWGRRALLAWWGVCLVFLYAPIAVLVAFSFNDSRLNVTWRGFTLTWYSRLLTDHRLLEAAWNSLIVAVVSTAVATVLGTALALGLHRGGAGGRRWAELLLYIPIVVPDTVMGISLLAFYAFLHFPLGLVSVILAHVTFSAPFVTLVVLARLEGLDPRLHEAALDLGANEWEAFRRVTLPLALPGVLAGALLAFTLSLDDFVVTFFTSGPGATTLPLYIFSMVRLGVSPHVNALSALLLAATLTVVGLAQRWQAPKPSGVEGWSSRGEGARRSRFPRLGRSPRGRARAA